jgi:uncharacterized membrane protein
MAKKLLFLAAIAAAVLSPAAGRAAEIDNPALHPDAYYRARITHIAEEGLTTVDDLAQYHQRVTAAIVSGARAGESVTIDHGASFAIRDDQRVAVGDQVVITETAGIDGEPFYYVSDWYRGTGLFLAVVLFFILAIAFGRKRGITSLCGLALTIIAIFYWLLPAIARGADPLWTAAIGGFGILVLSLYLSHGFNRRTTLALASASAALVIAIVLDIFFVRLARLSGTGAEEALFLQLEDGNVNLVSLLLAGILLGVLGILDDITTGQTAAIEEIHRANPAVSFAELYRSGMSVGREHIASLINTLVLAYAGAAFPLLLLYTTQKNFPLWVILNGNFLAEEIIRTVVGSAALVLAVPITTLIAAGAYAKKIRKA